MVVFFFRELIASFDTARLRGSTRRNAGTGWLGIVSIRPVLFDTLYALVLFFSTASLCCARHHCAVLDFFILGLWILLSRLCVGWDLEHDMFKMILQFYNKIHVFVKTIFLIIYICFWFHVCYLFIDCLSFLSSISHVIRATETLDVLTTYAHLS